MVGRILQNWHQGRFLKLWGFLRIHGTMQVIYELWKFMFFEKWVHFLCDLCVKLFLYFLVVLLSVVGIEIAVMVSFLLLVICLFHFYCQFCRGLSILSVKPKKQIFTYLLQCFSIFSSISSVLIFLLSFFLLALGSFFLDFWDKTLHYYCNPPLL